MVRSRNSFLKFVDNVSTPLRSDLELVDQATGAIPEDSRPSHFRGACVSPKKPALGRTLGLPTKGLCQLGLKLKSRASKYLITCSCVKFPITQVINALSVN